jgi:membrane-associated phospholipid phosphatase
MSTDFGPFDPDSRPFYAILALVACISAVILLVSGFHLSRAVWFILTCWPCFMIAGMGIRRLGFRRAGSALEMIAAVHGQAFLCSTLIVGVTALRAPYADQWLSAADRALEFAWGGFVDAFRGHELLWATAYDTFRWQSVLVVALLCWRGETTRAWIFVTAATLSLFVATLAFAAAPALGPYQVYGVPQFGPYISATKFIEPMEYIRNGGREFTLRLFSGSITFPSYHAASALLFCFAAWPTRLRWPVFGVNVLMLIGAIVVGGHYFVDLPAGVALGAIALYAARKLLRMMEKREVSSTPLNLQGENMQAPRPNCGRRMSVETSGATGRSVCR